MQTTNTFLPDRRFAQTMREDTWWLQPVAVVIGLSCFIVYATWAAFQGTYYHYGPYLSPFYSPEIFGASEHSWFGPKPAAWPSWLPWSPAFLILWAPGGFRFTCYYYRGAYYKAFGADPLSCSVGEGRNSYKGENSPPLIFQNIHRYFMYIAVVFLVFLSIDVWKALWFENHATGQTEFGMGVGTLVLAMNVVLLGGYTLGCHSLRHLIGGRFNNLSRRPISKQCYGCVSKLNAKHMLFAWMSLFWVGFSDVYVRLCAMGIWTDLRLF